VTGIQSATCWGPWAETKLDESIETATGWKHNPKATTDQQVSCFFHAESPNAPQDESQRKKKAVPTLVDAMPWTRCGLPSSLSLCQQH